MPIDFPNYYDRKANMAIVLLLFLLFKTQICDDTVQHFFEELNEAHIKYNNVGALLAWHASVEPDMPRLAALANDHLKKRLVWKDEVCQKLLHVFQRHPRSLNMTHIRQMYLFCRGINSTLQEASEISRINEELRTMYSDIEICIPDTATTDTMTRTEKNVIKMIMNDKHHYPEVGNKTIIIRIEGQGLCFKGDREFQMVMEHSRKPHVLQWVWLVWREKIKAMKKQYKRLVDLENIGAKRYGFSDIGETWRASLEVPKLREFSLHLYESIKPLYTLLHGVVRFYLRQHYGDIVPETGPIPAYLLGDLWSQNWEPLADLLLPKTINLDQRMQNLNWTVLDMVKRAEDFYESLGLPPMTKKFWEQSVFTKGNRTKMRCHGSAVDMFETDDFRLLYCSERTFKDFSVIHHEMGHIQYFMAYQNQPGLFRQANAFLHEAIGDTIMQAVMTPQHLHRLRLINDSELFNSNSNKDVIFIAKLMHYVDSEYFLLDLFDTKSESEEINEQSSNFEDEKITIDDILLFKQALNKLPQIPFGYVVDEYRWRYFEGSLDKNRHNREFWDMAMKFQGIAPPDVRGEEYLDIGAEFHVPDNTPYMRYFLSNFVQHQIFENLCKAAVFGHRNIKDQLPFSIDLNRCDIYGSKPAGNILKDLMSRGESQTWQQILKETIGESNISASALKRYYRPLYTMLLKLVDKYKIPLGWESQAEVNK